MAKERTLRRLLIANRGEIAVRIQRACRDLGIQAVQIYSEADRESLAVKEADIAVCIGPARSSESYLRQDLVIDAALMLRADAIHPGYGFLSENAAFAALCEQNGITFVGPPASVIALMGDKASARAVAIEAGVPVTPGSSGTLRSARHAGEIARSLGYPVILKAVAGGGGRGMRVAQSEAVLPQQFESATREAHAAFGNGQMYIEKYLTNVRHVEIQILADDNQVVHLGERDCSSQRRNQKLVEESPSFGLLPEMRAAMGEAAVSLCRHVGYRNAGTIECMVDPVNDAFYFMEMNTRVQVEHPVTECVTGIDIVKEQIRVAEGSGLSFSQGDVHIKGHAIECRINAEDPQANFRPAPGLLTCVVFPKGPGIRVDSHVYTNYRIPPNYDSLIGKIIATGETRGEAIARMQSALGELRIEGVPTTAAFLAKLLASDAFVSGNVHTRYVEEFMEESSQ